MTEKFTILVVDDHANNRFTLRALLSRLPDCEVLEADSGEAALICTLEKSVHLVLLDVQMPGMDGFETAHHLQMTEHTRHIAIVFVTAVFKAEEFVARGFGLGAVDYLTKPIDDSLLLSRVRLYQHLRERELILEESVKQLLLSEKAMLQAKEQAEALTLELQDQTAKLKKLNLAIEHSPHSVFITDAQGAIEYVNPRFVEYTGYSLSEVIGRNPRFLKSGHTSQETFQKLWATIRAGGVWHGELMNQRKNGSFYWVSVAVAPVTGAGGDVTHFVAMHVDITEQMHSQTHLRLAKEDAERANRAKSVFLANMSHELRTPLNAILGFANLLQRDTRLEEESRKKLATINRAGQHLLTLINDVLEISRIEVGGAAIRPAPLDFFELLISVEEIVGERAQSKGLIFSVEKAVDLPLHVMGDGYRLKQVLINLLGNAVKYTEQGTVHLRVSRCDEEIVFEVTDTGPGIAVADQERIFQAFYQTEAGIAKGEGTGLGLAISREYTELMGGHLEVMSQPGKGSVFTLKVALQDVDAITVTRSMGRVIGLQAGQEGMRILVVDDKADNRELTRQLLEAVGFDVRTADDGEQAVQVFQSWHPCYIWMDMRMPVLDGYQATRQIRALPGGDKVRIVALTASAFEEDRQKILAAGCDDMVKKPLEEERLFAVMGDLLGLHYRYMDEEALPFMHVVTSSDLSVLSPDTIRELMMAAQALDLNVVQQIVANIGIQHPALAAALDEKVRAFQFDRIVALCQAN